MSPADRPVISPARHAERLERALAATAAHGLDGLLVGVGPDLRYLTGYLAMPLERLTMLVLSSRGAAIVVPRLERGAAEAGVSGDVEILTFDEGADPYALVTQRLDAGHGASATVAVSDTLWASHLLGIQAAIARDARFGSSAIDVASSVLRELRMVKDAEEIGLLRLAAQAADRVVAQIAAGPLVGRTEADVSREVRARLLTEGHEEAGFAIVGSGPNSASPHHEASDRVIGAGEPIVLDIGGRLSGYGSDITRTLWVTGGDAGKGPDETFRHLFGVLHGAQAAATRAVRPGVACEAVDAAARQPIEAAGYGEAFFHRTGHGIGLEEHEDPYIIAGNTETLRAGMAFSVEPGIYLVGRYGARIEDILVCGPDGPIAMNEAPRELYVVDG
jgi:Xaa-Pro aminopeptidase